MTNNIHPTAIVEDSVNLGNNITVGPYSYLSGNLTIGNNCILHSHVVISGKTTIGNNNKFFPFCNIGAIPQDLKYDNEDSILEIGNNNVFRENVTVHAGTILGNKYYNIKNLTKIENNCLFMVGSHIAHDCIIEDNVILANNATLGGHAYLEKHVIVGGLSAIQQFVRIGEHAIIGGMSGVESDVIPFALVMGERANLAGVNIVGLKRSDFSRNDISNIKKAYDILFDNSDITFSSKVDKVLAAFLEDKNINKIISFINQGEQKPICKPKNYNLSNA